MLTTTSAWADEPDEQKRVWAVMARLQSAGIMEDIYERGDGGPLIWFETLWAHCAHSSDVHCNYVCMVFDCRPSHRGDTRQIEHRAQILSGRQRMAPSRRLVS